MRTTLGRPCVDTISLYWSGSLTSYANIVLGRVTDLDCGYCFFSHMDIDLFDKLRTQPCEINIHDPGTKVRSVTFIYTPHVAIKKPNGHLMAYTSTVSLGSSFQLARATFLF